MRWVVWDRNGNASEILGRYLIEMNEHWLARRFTDFARGFLGRVAIFLVRSLGWETGETERLTDWFTGLWRDQNGTGDTGQCGTRTHE